MLRAYAQDFADRNRLNDDKEEFSPTEYRIAIIKTFADLDTVPPVSISLSAPGTLPPINFFLGFGICNLIEMSIFRRLRNDLQYTDGGLTIDTEKFEKYSALLNEMRTYYFTQVNNFKQSLNKEEVQGLLPSSYSFVFFPGTFAIR